MAVSEQVFREAELPDRIAAAASLGWPAIGLLRRSLWKFGEERTAELLHEHGMAVSSLSWAGGFTGSAGFTYREAIEDGRAAIAEVRRLGAETLIVAPGARGGHTYRHAQRVVVDGLRHLGDIAARCGVTLAVLTAPTRKQHARWTSIDTLELAQQLLDLAACPAVGLAIPAERWHDHPTATTALQSLAPRIRLVTSNLKSHTATPLAQTSGPTPTEHTLGLLWNSGFNGAWELDSPADSQPGFDPSTLALESRHYTMLAQGMARRSGGLRGCW